MADRGPTTGTIVRIVTVVAAMGLLFYAAYAVRQIIILALVAFFLAVGLDPAVHFLGRLRFSRGRAVAVVILGLFLFVGGFAASVIPPLVRQTQNLAEQIPGYAQELSTRSERFRELDERYDIRSRLESAVGSLPDLAGRSVGGVLGVAKSVGRAVFSLLTVFILTTYFLLDFLKLVDGGMKLVPLTRRQRVGELMTPVFERISGYIMGQLTVSLIGGVVSLILLNVLRVPYALPLAMWVAISALIPMVGSTIGAVPAVIVAFFHSTWTGVGTLAFFLVYQQIENYVVAPRVMRRAVDISAAAVIVAALVGATLLGFVGALLAIPVAASIKVLAQEVWMPRQNAL